MKKTSGNLDLFDELTPVDSDVGLEQRIKSIQNKAPSRPNTVVETLPGEPSLQIWADEFRTLPNDILRSALFTARNRCLKREQHVRKEIAVVGRYELFFTGTELRQEDELVWMQVLHLARGKQLGELIEFTPHAFLTAINHKINKQAYTRLQDTLLRLKGGNITIDSPQHDKKVTLPLIDDFDQEGDNGIRKHCWGISLKPALHKIFVQNNTTRIEMATRVKLPSGIASKLYSFYMTHQSPYPILLTTIHELCGLDMPLKNFKKSAAKAFDVLVTEKSLKSWKYKEGKNGLLVEVERSGKSEDKS